MKRMKINRLFQLVAFFYLLTQGLSAQNPDRFKSYVDGLSKKEYHFDINKETLLFAGSSSIRKWNDIDKYFPEYNVINNGFGGSQFSDLIYFYDKLIGKYNPDIIFIYEGDNDIAYGKKPSEILKDAKTLLSKVRKDFKDIPVVFISVKPSIKRWELNKKYIATNKKLAKLCKKEKNVWYIDVWDIMLDKNGKLKKDLFLEDGLHMNAEGYNLWKDVINKKLSEIKN